MKRGKAFWALLAFTLTLIRCGGSEVGNPEGVTLRVTGLSAAVAPKISPRAIGAGAPTITSARIVLGSIKFKSMAECLPGAADTSELKYEGPYVVDLIANTTIPDLGLATILANTYCEIVLKMERLQDNRVPTGISLTDPIVNQSFLVEGAAADGTPFTAMLDSDEAFKLSNTTTGFAIGLNGATDFFIAFRLADWFAGIDLSTADAPSGTILIDKDHNAAILDQLKSNIKLSSRLFEDVDKDGKLEPTEWTDDKKLADGGL